MGKTEKNTIFIQNPNKKDRLLVFQDKLKRHLSNEYLYIVDKKDDLENQLVQLRVEQSQKNKTLFPNVEQKDVRKYFSPLNIQEIADDQKDEKDKQLLIDIDHLQDEIRQLDVRMHEIREFLHDIDELLSEEEDLSLLDKNSYIDDFELVGQTTSSELETEVDNNESVENKESDVNRSYQQKEDNYSDIVEFLDENRVIYPQILRNLYDYSDFIHNAYDIEVLIEFNDNNIETSVDINRNLLSQINYNVNTILRDYDISTLLILGEVTAHKINISLHYVCDLEEIEAMNVSYEIKYVV